MGNAHVQEVLDIVQLHAPSTIVGALFLAGCLAAIAYASWRIGDWLFAALLTVGGFLGYLFVGMAAIPAVVAATLLVAMWYRQRRPDRRPLVSGVPFLWQILVILGAQVIYVTLRVHIESGFDEAHANALSVIDWEKSLGLFFEPGVQARVLPHKWLTRAFDTYYSFGFLAIVCATLVWLYITDRSNYSLYRNCLGISAVLAVLTIALFPVAPPRLVPEAGIIDTVVANGNEHGFANDYAAVPSLHVGWTMLASLLLVRSIRSKWGILLALLGPMMFLTVIVTGNHYWVDGAIGMVFAIGPALLGVLMSRSAHGHANWFRNSTAWSEFGARWSLAWTRGKTRFTVISLLGLLTYLFVGESVDPGFTNFWGYLVFQMVATLFLLVGAEVYFAPQGGISWVTHVIAVVCGYLDVLGTAGGLYGSIDEYDKITHFMGVAAFTSGAYDVGLALWRKGVRSWVARERITFALIVGISIGVAWEVYEFLGDKVFHTTRVQGRWDTVGDIVFDTLGAITVVVVLAWLERTQPDRVLEAPAATIPPPDGP